MDKSTGKENQSQNHPLTRDKTWQQTLELTSVRRRSRRSHTSYAPLRPLRVTLPQRYGPRRWYGRKVPFRPEADYRFLGF